jgi:hypothetical protein
VNGGDAVDDVVVAVGIGIELAGPGGGIDFGVLTMERRLLRVAVGALS